MTLVAGTAIVLSLHVVVAWAETRLELVNPDEAARAVFASAAINELKCRVLEKKPAIGIDLRFHAGFSVTLPLKALAGEEAGTLRTFVRVTPFSAPDRTAYLSMTTPAPAIDRDAGGDVELSGAYVVGPGRYMVDLLLTFGDAVCRKQWQVQAKLKRPFSQLQLALPADTAGELPPDPFEDPAQEVTRAPNGKYVKLLVNFSPAGLESTIMDGEDVRAVIAILRAVSHEPDFGRFSLVAFSSDQERVLHRQPIAPKIDFRTLGRVVRRLRTGVVSIRQMRDPRSTTHFLEKLLAEELYPGQQPPAAVVVISPKVSLDERLSERDLAARGRLRCPVFLLTYNPEPAADPWQGVLARAVKNAYQGLAYTVASPRDLGKAILRLRSELPNGR